MSQLAPGVGTCPRCGAQWASAVFSSIDADTIPIQVNAILDGTFESRACQSCGASFRAEHPMLFVSHARRLWIVMHPLADRVGYASLEPAVESTIMDTIEQAAPVVEDGHAVIYARADVPPHAIADEAIHLIQLNDP